VIDILAELNLRSFLFSFLSYSLKRKCINKIKKHLYQLIVTIVVGKECSSTGKITTTKCSV